MSKADFIKIKSRMPYGVPYIEHYDIISIIKKSENFEAVLDKKISQLAKKGIDVSLCPEYLESLVEEHISILLSELERKHHTNKNKIQNFFNRRISDKLELNKSIDILEEQIASIEEELATVQILYKALNPLYNGRLKLEGEKLDYGNKEEDN